jgi:hypothetical protein
MPRRATGDVIQHGEKLFARVAIGPRKRKAVLLPHCKTEADARERSAIMAELVAELRRTGRVEFIPTVLERVATEQGERLAAFIKLAKGYAAGVEVSSARSATQTFSGFRRPMDQWRSRSRV